MHPTSPQDRKSTRLNSSHLRISYAVFCLKKKKTTTKRRFQCFWDRRADVDKERYSQLQTLLAQVEVMNREALLALSANLFIFFFNDRGPPETYPFPLNHPFPT